MRRFHVPTFRPAAAALVVGLGLTAAGTATAGAALNPPTTPVACTISGAGYLYGTPGNDVICGSAGDDHIYGYGGNDLIYGGSGADVLSGGLGDDSVYAGYGSDQLYGDAGLGDHLYAKDGVPWDTLHDPDGAWYQADLLWPPQPSIPNDSFDFTGPYTNYHWIQ
jgi:Ca2+-binding RTX toxin-like protein